MIEKKDPVKEEFEELRADVKQIKEALLGSAFNQNKGFVYMLNEHEERLKKLEDRWVRMQWLLMGMSMGAGAGLASFIYKVIQIMH